MLDCQVINFLIFMQSSSAKLKHPHLRLQARSPSLRSEIRERSPDFASQRRATEQAGEENSCSSIRFFKKSYSLIFQIFHQFSQIDCVTLLAHHYLDYSNNLRLIYGLVHAV